MPTTDVPQIGLGTTVVITPLSGTAITAIKVQNIKQPTLSGKDVETTGMSDLIDQYIPGVLNAGEAEFEVVYLKTQSAALEALTNVAGTTFTFTYPDGRVKAFVGFINNWGEEVPLKEKIMNKIKIRATTRSTNA